MGVFDKLFKVDKEKAKVLKLNPAESFLGIVLSAVSADGIIAPIEQMAVYYSLGRIPMCYGLTQQQVGQLLNNFSALIHREGVGTIVSVASKKLNQPLRETAFALAVDIVLADGVVNPQEKEFLEHLQKAVGISDKLATEIVEAMIIKNRGAGEEWFNLLKKDDCKHLYR